MNRKLKSALAFVFSALLCVSVFPTRIFALSYESDGTRIPYATDDEYGSDYRPINLFLSNFAETGLPGYNAASDDQTVIACVLKHIELNAAQYDASDVEVRKDAAGRRYMRVKAQTVTRRANEMFGRTLREDALPGYNSGWCAVTADHADAPVVLFVDVAEGIRYLGSRTYSAAAYVYKAPDGVKSEYYNGMPPVPEVNVEVAYIATAVFRCEEIPADRAYTSKDFRLVSWELSTTPAANAGTFGDNEPYALPLVPAEEPSTEPLQTQPAEQPVSEQPSGDLPAQPTASDPSEPGATDVPAENAEPAPEKQDRRKNRESDENEEPDEGTGSLKYPVVMIVLGSLFCVLVAALIVLLILRKRYS